jgi:hypothetical protein
MTSADVVMILLRRWPVVVAGLVLTVAAIVGATASQGVYSTQTDVLFLAPRSAVAPNPIESSSDSLVATAGLIARIANRGAAAPATASSSVSLTSQGIRKGYSIELPNSGGQWVNNFDRPVLVVQVVGPSEAWVRSTLATEIDQINSSLAALQKRDGIPKKSSIITSSAPRLATVDYATGDPRRVMAAMILLGTALTGFAAIGVDRLIPRIRRARLAQIRPGRTETA